MNLRDIFIENFAGDLEYHPRRGILYFVLALAALCFWYFSPSRIQFTTIPLVFALGGLSHRPNSFRIASFSRCDPV